MVWNVCFNLFFFLQRVPSKGNRDKWILAIEQCQLFPQNRKIFNVCIRHFVESDYEKKDDKFTLSANAIPSVFNSQNSNDFFEIIPHELIDEEEGKPKKCVQCPCLLQKIKELEKEIFHMKTEHSMLLSRFERKNTELAELKKANSEKTNQLENSQKETLNLKDILGEMRSQNYISDSERDYLNVCNCF